MLEQIQGKLNVPKNQRNNFGGYNYRSCEDIVEAVKPVLAEHKLSLIMTDEIIEVGGRIYVKATASISDAKGEVKFTASAYAREPQDQKGMNESQITGAASSYARKYALNGLFALDDNKDADTDEHAKQTAVKEDVGIIKQFKSAKTVNELIALWEKLNDNERKMYASYKDAAKKRLEA